MAPNDEIKAPAIREVMGLPVSVCDMEEAVTFLSAAASSSEPVSVTYLNPDCVNLAFADPGMAEIYRGFDATLADGIGLVWAAGKRGVAIPERCAVSDIFPLFLRECEKLGTRLYFLGAKPGTTEKMIEKIRETFPALQVAGGRDGYFSIEEEVALIKEINVLKPDAVLIGMGAPRQEKWVMKNRFKIDAPLCWCVGGLFDFYSGNVARAPEWLIKIHMEWIFRLLMEPGRMWRRYIIGNPLFILRALLGKNAR